MKLSTVLVSCATFLAAAATGLPAENNSFKFVSAENAPTHIIKFKNNLYNGTAAHNLVASKHREYMLMSLRAATVPTLTKTNTKRDRVLDDIEALAEEQDLLIQAEDMERRLSLEHISIDNDFVAVSGVFPDNGFIDLLHNDEAVEYVETNHIYKATFLLPEAVAAPEVEGDSNLKKRYQLSASPDWGLARIHKRTLGELDSYEFDETAGSGIDVFVLDSGVNIGHKDFEGRAHAAANFVDREDDIDLGGHGTHVAGKIAGKMYGVAKSANIHSVKILNRSGDGTMSNLIKGISHVIQVATPGKALINLSLSGPKSRLIDEAVSKLVNDYNIPVFVSAGNSGTDACYFSPSSNPDVFAVGATDINDKVPYYSDTGRCVKVYAPGSNIKSTWIGGSDETKVLDGTSMANPHVVGIAASLMAKHSFHSPKELYEAIIAKATSNMLTFTTTSDADLNSNLIAYNGIH